MLDDIVVVVLVVARASRRNLRRLIDSDRLARRTDSPMRVSIDGYTRAAKDDEERRRRRRRRKRRGSPASSSSTLCSNYAASVSHARGNNAVKSTSRVSHADAGCSSFLCFSRTPFRRGGTLCRPLSIVPQFPPRHAEPLCILFLGKTGKNRGGADVCRV